MTNVIVVGSANQDYVVACDALPVPGETRLGGTLQRFPGGKGVNQAVSAARLGSDVVFVGAVGDDDDGALLIRELRAEGVDTSEIEISTTERTGMAFVSVLPSGENAITVVSGANFGLTAERVSRTVTRLADANSIVVFQGEIPVAAIESAAAAAVTAGARILLNLAPFVAVSAETLRQANPLVLNEIEAAAIAGYPIDSVETAVRASKELLGHAESVVLTLGGAGASWADRASSGLVPAPPVERVVDTTGAGDAFIGGLATVLAEGRNLEAAVRVAVEVGTVAVTRVGAQASYPSRRDIRSLTDQPV